MVRQKSGPEGPQGPEEAVGRAIRVIRTEQGMSRKELARRSELSYPYVSEIETGKKSPSSRALRSIADAFGLPVHELLAAAETLALGTRSWTSPARRSFFHESAEAVRASRAEPTDDFYAERIALEPMGDMNVVPPAGARARRIAAPQRAAPPPPVAPAAAPPPAAPPPEPAADAESDELVGRFEALGARDRQLVLEFIRRLTTG
jgi:transcriptional regulator with XRE-family HTH domain